MAFLHGNVLELEEEASLRVESSGFIVSLKVKQRTVSGQSEGHIVFALDDAGIYIPANLKIDPLHESELICEGDMGDTRVSQRDTSLSAARDRQVAKVAHTSSHLEEPQGSG